MPPEVDTSPLSTLQRVHIALPDERVSIGWLHTALDTQAAYLLIFVFGLLGALPAVSLPAGLAIAAFSLPLMFARAAGLPQMIADRQIRTSTARYAIGRAIALLQFSGRWTPSGIGGLLLPFRPVAGALLFVLGLSLLVPIPLSNVLPALSASILALSLLEDSVGLFVAGTVGALASLAVIVSAMLAAASLVARF